MLGKKYLISNEQWLDTAKNIETIVSKPELDKIVSSTVADIKKAVKGKQTAFCWSGGKDSIVLENLCRMAGVSDCISVTTNLEYPAFSDWIAKHKPQQLEIINTGQDLAWLKEHQEMLFPQDSATAAKWFHIVQHRGQAEYFRTHKKDMLLLGRRKKDGNYVGKGNMYTDKLGVVRYSPMADWKHEYILAFMRYYRLAWPPIYRWKNGFLCGTHPWAARQWTQNSWQEVYDIDKNIVIQAAKYIDAAKQFLKGVPREKRT
jgi:3'-phosphoadenosine 5'-phosphosulfate sulfotransferase (PAPS reductase)/FAD synthetase